METITLTVTGMKCGGCEANVRSRLSAMAGVGAVAASSKEGRVRVEFDSAQTDAQAIRQAIAAAGFGVADAPV